ncbi:hypothetical protein DIPPA_09571 [Diplonema papillatum]|nr:hypothetical protein DIPPA_09571 [Diplonema papillatum]
MKWLAGCAAAAAGGGLWTMKLMNENRDTNQFLWRNASIVKQVNRCEPGAAEGDPERSVTAAVCKTTPPGLTHAYWGQPMSEGVWEWTVRQEAGPMEVGISGLPSFVDYHFKVMRPLDEVASWRGVIGDFINHAGVTTTSLLDKDTPYLCFELDMDAKVLTITDANGMRAKTSTPPDHAPYYAAVRFSKAPAALIMVHPPHRIDQL